MTFRRTLQIATESILAHKARSILTILGVIIGVTSIIIIVSIGKGAENLISNEITSLGADIVWIEPGREPEGPTDFASAIFSNTLKTGDIEALKDKNNVPGLVDIAPAVMVPGSVSYEGETYRPISIGWSAKFFGNVYNIFPEEGSYFDDISIRNKEKVAVLGSRVKDELFGENNAIGETIKIKDVNFRVVGVLPKKGQIMFFDIGELVMIPYTTAQSQLLGIDYYNEVWVQVKSVDVVEETVLDIKETLRNRHGITNPEKDDFYILTQQNLLDQISNILNIVTTLIGSVVAISLVVGGVGIMNIMLVSVAERTKEIGLRKAIGATKENITTQFLLEAAILAGVGGLFGIIFGAIISFAITTVFSAVTDIPWTFVFPLPAAVLGFVVAIITGIVFGIYPARQAAKKSPIEAIRYE